MKNRVESPADKYCSTRARVRQLSGEFDNLIFQIVHKAGVDDHDTNQIEDRLLFVASRMLARVRVSTLRNLGLLPATEILGKRYFQGRDKS